MTDEQQQNEENNKATVAEGRRRIPLEHVTIEYEADGTPSFVASSSVLSACVLLEDSSAASTVALEWKALIKIGQGTVIHPLTNITFLLPSGQVSGLDENDQSSSNKTIVIHICQYNVIQECCTLELTFDKTSAAVECDGASWNWNAIGHYNKFGPKTKFQKVVSIGNDNVFDGANVIDASAGSSTSGISIGNSVVMTPALVYRPLGQFGTKIIGGAATITTDDETKEQQKEENLDDLNHVILFQLPRNTIHRRTCSPMEHILEQQRHQLKELAKSHLQHLSQHHKSLV